MALAWEVGVEGLLPLWTFGKITNLWDAAEANVELGRHEVNKAKNEIRHEVRRAYYGLLLAKDSRVLLRRAMRKIDDYIADLEARVADGEADDIDLLKIRMQRAELVARGTEIDKGERKAMAGLRFFTGVTGSLEVPNVPLAPIDHSLGSIAKYLEAARLHRPEVNMAKAGLAARRAQVQLEKSKFYPDFGLGMTAKLQRAPEVTDQRNPFTRDPGNRAWYGLGVVFRWNLDLLPQAARLAQARANLEEVRATERYALGGIATEVEISHAEAEAAKKRLDAWTEAVDYAKRWMIKVQQGKDMGLFEDEDLVEPSKAYALKKAEEMEALYDYNMALSNLAQSTGWESMLR
jgi:outer membrane protein TolC